jgi:hypothetical protein
MPWRGDDVGARGEGTLHQRVGVPLRRCADGEEALVVAWWGDLAVAEGPPEPATRDEHQMHTGVDDELQRLRDTVVGELAEGLEAEGAAVEVVGRSPVRDGKADHDGFVVDGALLRLGVLVGCAATAGAITVADRHLYRCPYAEGRVPASA